MKPMNDLKLRVWDPERGEMRYPTSIRFDCERGAWANPVGYRLSEAYDPRKGMMKRATTPGAIYVCEGASPLSDWDAMLFSGLYDRSGKEVFAEDLVSPEDEPTIMRVVFRHGAFLLQEDPSLPPLVPLSSYLDPATQNGLAEKPAVDLEVIGNTYEYSHLFPVNGALKKSE